MDIDRLAGKRLGNYEIESLLGRGGMGMVYKARQISLDRPVALKILPPILSSDASFVKRFKREARAVAKLSHSNIIQIHDITEEQNLHFFSMEYVEGKTLDKVLEEKGRLEPNEAVRIVLQAAMALEHAHKNNIIHRDVKPSNIIIDNIGNVKVMDFGLARAADDRSKVTQSGTLMGTLGYMSPEQCRGEELDFRTDIYSLGVVLYEMLTGKAPFEAPNEAALIHKIVSQEPTETRNLNPEVPADLSTIVSRAIRKNSSERYASISEFLKDIRALGKLTPSIMIAETKSIPSIAVLPFVNMSADPEQEYFCDGLAEELINALTQLKDLHVVARTSAFSFKGKDVNIRDIGRELNVDTVLEGSVRKAGIRVRITTQLVNVDNGYHLWSERYDKKMEDIFDIQDEISQAIVDKLKPTLLRDEMAKLGRRQTVNLTAYNLYLRGRWFADKRTAASLKKAIEHFEKAIEEQPNYAHAYAGLADCYSLLSMFGPFPPKKVFPKAREAASRALEIDNTLAEAHTSLGMCKEYYDWDWEGAEREYRRAIELNPGYATAHHQYAMHLARMGRFAEAIKEIERALDLDPLSLIINSQVGLIYYFAGENEKAIIALKKTIEMDPDFVGPRFVLGSIYLRKHMYEEAVEQMDRGEKVPGEWETPGLMMACYAYALTGRRDEAEKVLKGLLERSEQEYVPPVYLALFYFLLRDVDEGFTWLDKAYDERDAWMCFLKVHPILDFLNLRSDPRYIAVLKKMNLDK